LGTHAEGSWVERDDGYYEVGLPAAKVIAGNVTQLVVTEPGGRVLRGSVAGASAIDTTAVREAARLALADPLPTGAVIDSGSVEARVGAIERETLTELTGTITATNNVVVTATLDREPPAVLLRLANGVGVVSAQIADDADNKESRAVVSIASPDGIAPPLAFDLTLDAAPTAVNPDGTGSVVLLLGEPGAARLASAAKTAAEGAETAAQSSVSPNPLQWDVASGFTFRMTSRLDGSVAPKSPSARLSSRFERPRFGFDVRRLHSSKPDAVTSVVVTDSESVTSSNLIVATDADTTNCGVRDYLVLSKVTGATAAGTYTVTVTYRTQDAATYVVSGEIVVP
ncbi:MAG: hypothetical protein AAF805_01185, partial [Planctomycetota bacterium]